MTVMGRGHTSIAVALIALAAAAPAAAKAPPRPLTYLHVGAAAGPAGLPQITDENGRAVLLKGANADGLVDYWRQDLNPPYPTDPAAYARGACPPDDPSVEGVMICDFDFPQWRPIGWNVVRLNLSWSLLEPQPGRIDQQYLDRIAQVVAWAMSAGVYVLLDMHQDAWSKHIYTKPGDTCADPFKATRGYDGAPEWASRASTPACALNGVRELDPAVAESFQKLWVNAPAPDGVGLQDHYADVMIALAKRFHGDPAVAGYEIINEPSPGFAAPPGASDATEMFPFYGKVVNAVTAAVPGFRQLFFVEPNTERNVTDAPEALNPWAAYSSYPNVVYAPHVYTGVFTADQQVASTRFFPSDGGYRSAIVDATALGLPLWVGEFGNSPQDDAALLAPSYALQDKYGLGGAIWLWKENANDVNGAVNWSVFGPPFGHGTPNPARMPIVTRAYPLFLAGELKSMTYDPPTRGFDIRASSAAVACGDRAHATLVFVPGSTPVAVENARAEAFDRPGGREVYVYPDGGAYRVRSAASASMPAPCANPQGLPPTKRCVDRRKFTFTLHGRRVTDVQIFVDGRRLVHQHGQRITTVTLQRLPIRTFVVKVVARTSDGRRTTTVRRYHGCRKGRPRGRHN
jgi:endoglycosylceramidase